MTRKRDSDGDEPCLVDDAALCVHETDQALCVELPNLGRTDFWVPKSVVHDDSEVWGKADDCNHGKLIVKRWFAREHDLGDA